MSDATDERIREHVSQHRSELAQLVDQALERELTHLVEERLAQRNSGAGDARAARNGDQPVTAGGEDLLKLPRGETLRASSSGNARSAAYPSTRRARACARREHDGEQPAEHGRPAPAATRRESTDEWLVRAGFAERRAPSAERRAPSAEATAPSRPTLPQYQ